jgi:hypothetical protein
VATFALDAEDPLRLGKTGLALLVDQAVGEDDRFFGHGDPIEILPVVGIGYPGDIPAKTDPSQQGTHWKEKKGGNEFESAAILGHGPFP